MGSRSLCQVCTGVCVRCSDASMNRTEYVPSRYLLPSGDRGQVGHEITKLWPL